MKKITLFLSLTIVAALAVVYVKNMDVEAVKTLLKEYKIIASKPDIYYSYDRIVKKHPWGLIVKKDDEYFVVDLDGNKLNEQGFSRIHSFDEFGIAEVENSDRLVGLINTKGELVVDTLYDDINGFGEDQLAIVETRIPYSDQNNGQQVRYKSREGLIDRSGKLLIEPDYFNITYLEDIALYLVDHYHYQESLGSKRSLFSASKGWLENGTYDSIGKFIEGIAVVRKNDHHGVINSRGEFVIPLIYDQVSEASDGLLRVNNFENEVGFFDSKGNIVIPFKDYRPWPFNYGVSIVLASKSNRKVALMDKTGKFLTDYKFEHIDAFKHYLDIDEVLALADPPNSRFRGLIDTTGRYIIEPKFSGIKYDKNGYFRTLTYVFPEDRNKGTQSFFYFIDLAGNEYVELDYKNPEGEKPGNIGRLGILNSERSIIAEPIYDDVRPISSGIMAVRQGTQWGVINDKIETLLPTQYQAIEVITPSITFIKLNDKWGAVDLADAELLLPIEYDELKYLSVTQISAKKDNQWSIIDL